MYLATKRKGRRVEYLLRRSVERDGRWVFQDLFNLGPDPGAWIVYPGGHGFYFNPILTETLEDLGVAEPDRDLEKVFLPFLEAEIQRIVLQTTWLGRKKRRHYSQEAMTRLQDSLHPFDKFRYFYHRFGRMDASRVILQPMKCYNRLLEKSRDELEAMFRTMEAGLRVRERKAYVYHALDLARHFPGISGRAPMELDMDLLDRVFIDELCRLNRDPAFRSDPPGEAADDDSLSEYLIHYAILWFDFEFGQKPPVARIMDEFIHAHRAYRPPLPARVMDVREACGVLDIPEEEYRRMNRRELAKLYRKKALAAHPDHGGDPEDFLRLNTAYERLATEK